MGGVALNQNPGPTGTVPVQTRLKLSVPALAMTSVPMARPSATASSNGLPAPSLFEISDSRYAVSKGWIQERIVTDAPTTAPRMDLEGLESAASAASYWPTTGRRAGEARRSATGHN